MSDFVPWLRGLADKGGKGVVNNIDARCLGRVADEIERLRAERTVTLSETWAKQAAEIERLRPFEKFYNDAVAAETSRRENVAGWRR
jgi:hypothetical protein